jgi:signal transduction histidine kinase
MSSARSDRGAPAGTRAWRSLGARVAIWYVFVTVASFLAVATVFALRTRAWVERDAQAAAETTLERYRNAFESGGNDAVRALFAAEGARGLVVRVIDERDVDVLEVASREAPKRNEKAANDWHVAATRVSNGQTLEIVVRDDVAANSWSHAREALWWILACALVSAVVGGLLITRRSLRPVSDLARATETIIASGDLALRVPIRGTKDDLEQLAELFNRMLARNERLVRAMKDSLDNVAHDLRTPLTRLRAGAEVALCAPPDDAKRKDALADVVEETDRVLAMMTALLDITEAETGAMRLDKKNEDLSSIVREAIELYDLVANERGVHIVSTLIPSVMVFVDRRRIVQVCANLIDNAIKYSEPGGRIEITTRAEDGWGVATIRDNGAGIPLEDQPRVWDRLFRADQSRTERGLGLGLSLVKAVVEAHGGEVRLRSEVKKGSTFEVRLKESATPRAD